MNTILINRTYATITPESAAHGCYEDQGYLAKDEEVTLRELVDLMRGGTPSCSPALGETYEWVTYNRDEDILDCTETFESVHYAREQVNPQAPKMWRMAFKLARLA